jgi:hypothetical protein
MIFNPDSKADSNDGKAAFYICCRSGFVQVLDDSRVITTSNIRFATPFFLTTKEIINRAKRLIKANPFLGEYFAILSPALIQFNKAREIK